MSTVQFNRMSGCVMETDEVLKNIERISFDIQCGEANNIIVIKWHDKKLAHLAQEDTTRIWEGLI